MTYKLTSKFMGVVRKIHGRYHYWISAKDSGNRYSGYFTRHEIVRDFDELVVSRTTLGSRLAHLRNDTGKSFKSTWDCITIPKNLSKCGVAKSKSKYKGKLDLIDAENSKELYDLMQLWPVGTEKPKQISCSNDT